MLYTTAFEFTLAMLYSLNDFDKALKNATDVPIYEIWYQATRSEAAATVFILILLCIALIALNACVESSSRLTSSFARDNALLGSCFIGQVHPRLQVPVGALVANSAVIFVIGCIYLGSTSAFNAFIGSGLLLQQCSFATPAALLLWHRRAEGVLPQSRAFKLGAFGWIANLSTVFFAPLITIMYYFPVALPVTGGTMNYTSAVHYKGPRLPAM
ncbi:amino acid polyamine transporter I [Fusarium tjaetaba]|uniref:Amino acid polyamine transporter I n=1 Tax=Fusarium tjaetaba TaxID=1567544 RepID=A0A8H5R536_9HYPO|nr:amino acid polyamine transporter I [Fusarium tjaetaba]KAF5626715.1 amino acid polyamine transporter I [Fusarium tjaetaba]